MAARRPADAGPEAAEDLAAAIANTPRRITLVTGSEELEEIAGKPFVVPRRGELVGCATRGERKDYRCERLPIVGRTGQCWDNALAESFFATIKRELLGTTAWPSRAAARTAIFDFI